jgi:DNA-binding beta-propeller fold protein YncE
MFSSDATQPRISALAGPFGFGSALVGSAPVGTDPSELAVNPATHTIYVANGNNDNGAQQGDGNTVSVIDARRCDAHDVSRCKGPWPTITVGSLPSGIAIDQQTDTVYVANVADNTVSVFNGATCNALHTSGCGQTPATVPVGLGPIDLFADPANHTVYVANFDSPANNSTAVSMINSATCNATDLAACPTTAPATVDVGNPPDQVDVNPATHTAYVTTLAGWSVFDTNTCSATVQAGCGTIGYLAGDPAGPNDGQVDTANDTLYTANFDNTISAFDLRDCNAGDLTGCAADTPGTVTPWPNPGFQEADLYVAVDQPLHSVYVSYEKSAALVVVDTSVCNGTHLAACATLNPPTAHTGANPEGVVLDPSTQTLYTANEVDDDISVIDATACNAENTRGCRHPAPSVSLPGPGPLATDSAVHTAYVTNGNDAVSMIDTASCNAHRLLGCAKTPPQLTAGENPDGVAVDAASHTVYIANSGAGATGTVSVIDDRTCNTFDQAGCADQKTLQVPGGNPDGILVNPANDTVYVTTIVPSGPDLISVFNGATCNATTTSGCSQTPAAQPVGDSDGGGTDLSLALNPKTNTLYATNVNYDNQTADTVYVINGASCDASDTNGCNQTPATITVGQDPRALVVDPSSDTIYVVIHAQGDFATTISVIDGATCNGQIVTGCNQTPATVAAGFGAIEAAIDLRTHRIYTANVEDTSVSMIDGTICNAINTSGCDQTPVESAVGNYPFWIALDPNAGTAYVSNIDNVSVVPMSRRSNR